MIKIRGSANVNGIFAYIKMKGTVKFQVEISEYRDTVFFLCNFMGALVKESPFNVTPDHFSEHGNFVIKCKQKVVEVRPHH